MKNEEGTFKQGNFLSNKFPPRGLRGDPGEGGSAQGTKGGSTQRTKGGPG